LTALTTAKGFKFHCVIATHDPDEINNVERHEQKGGILIGYANKLNQRFTKPGQKPTTYKLMRAVKLEDDEYHSLNEFIDPYDVLTIVKATSQGPYDKTWFSKNQETAHFYFHLEKTTYNAQADSLGYTFQNATSSPYSADFNPSSLDYKQYM